MDGTLQIHLLQIGLRVSQGTDSSNNRTPFPPLFSEVTLTDCRHLFRQMWISFSKLIYPVTRVGDRKPVYSHSNMLQIAIVALTQPLHAPLGRTSNHDTMAMHRVEKEVLMLATATTTTLDGDSSATRKRLNKWWR